MHTPSTPRAAAAAASPVDSTPTRSRLSGSLGTGSIAFMVIAAAAPLTVIGGNAPLAIGQGNGAGAPVGFLLASIVLLLFAVGFVALTPYVKEAGAFFSYVTVGLGSRLGMGTAYVALVAYTAIQAGIYGYMGWAMMDLVRHYGGPEIHWSVFAIASLVIVGFLGYRHIDLSSKVLGVALLLEMLVMMIVNVAVLINGGPEGRSLESFDPQVFLTPGSASPCSLRSPGSSVSNRRRSTETRRGILLAPFRAPPISRSRSSVSSTRCRSGCWWWPPGRAT